MTESAITPHILEALHNPAAYPVSTRTVALVQTHVSWLFMTDSHVYKIKKPVNFGFLDFSHLRQRHFYCREELRLNRRLCPDIYERVIPLRETDAGASFIGDGRKIDYAVMMKRLPAERMLDRLIDNGAVSSEELQRVALKISSFHGKAETSPHISTFGSLEQIQGNWQENFDQVMPFPASILSATAREAIQSYVDTFIRSHRLLFSQRVANGFIRDCDGDIHLGNICLMDDDVYIFDCIEFNERFRYSDTAADIAFLLMDLDFHRRPDLAATVLSTYISASGDGECPALIPFYKVYRAFVRGKVEGLLSLDSGIGEAERTAAEKRARRYFRLALGYCMRDRFPPTLFITSGTMGCGKSTLADHMAFELDLAYFNSDTVRKQLAGVPPETAVHVSFGEGLYGKEMNRTTYRQLEQLADAELAAGKSMIIDAGFGTAAHRSEFARLAASRNARFVILFVRCDLVEQRRRLRERALGGGSVSDGRVELLDHQIRVFEPPDNSEGTVIPCAASMATEQLLDIVYMRLLQ